MSIQKKSLIKTLKTTKKANVAASAAATNEGAVTRKIALKKTRFDRSSVLRGQG